MRAAALTLLAHLAQPSAPATRRMLLQGWPEAGSAVLKVPAMLLPPIVTMPPGLCYRVLPAVDTTHSHILLLNSVCC